MTGWRHALFLQDIFYNIQETQRANTSAIYMAENASAVPMLCSQQERGQQQFQEAPK